jgi:hypothetical protein
MWQSAVGYTLELRKLGFGEEKRGEEAVGGDLERQLRRNFRNKTRYVSRNYLLKVNCSLYLSFPSQQQ